ncbi:response regulator [Bacillus sp. ISL-40]|uniref:response regulator transcription factor n=1 Tax=unclassified Bacillus (in: firmicutes) TaxID=185979 RepID=UPI001BE7D107|nr:MULTISPECIES: response regulator [unclassified Bacillus (in: firmicutes)]MBT2695976.1 response regulator [Bacillus sp. ISL-40]MBT2739668.1 response regulator [Bacillus sp. ISL-77]
MGFKVLIADDEPLILKNLTQIIDWHALDCLIIGTAQNGQEALEILEKERIDLLLTDISMPGISGIDLLKQIQKLPYQPITLLISGYDDFEYAREGLKNNALDYILKPIDYDELQECVERAIGELKNQKIKEHEYEKFLIYELITMENIKPEVINKYQPYIAMAVKSPEQNIESIIHQIHDSCMKGNTKLFIYRISDVDVIVVLEFSNNLPVPIDGCVKGFAQQIVQEASQKCIVSIGPSVECLLDIRKSVDHTRELIKFDAFIKSAIITDGLIKEEYKRKQTSADLMNNAISFIKNHFEQDLGIEQVAEQVGLSVSYFSNLFKQRTGVTFLEYLTDVRVNYACLLLENLDLKTYEIAQKVGYTDQRYFSQVFKRKMKKTPSEYRKLFKKD